ncbi:hypothetical protein [Pseudomonas oryzihabitans]|nr:hypothetical protein [Pseudomonas psychrotolerans]
MTDELEQQGTAMPLDPRCRFQRLAGDDGSLLLFGTNDVNGGIDPINA